MSTSISLLLTISLCLLPLTAANYPVSPYHAALCLTQGLRCTNALSTLSSPCQARTPATHQTRACWRIACEWCTFPLAPSCASLRTLCSTTYKRRSHLSPSRYHAAKCIAQGPYCTPRLKTRSVVCNAFSTPAQQPDACWETACKWCKLADQAHIFPCSGDVLAIGCKLSNGNREGKIPLLSMPSVPPSEQFDIYSTPPIVMEYASVSPEATMEEIAPFGSVEPSLQPDQEHNLTSTTLGDEYFETVDDLLEVSPSPVSIEDVMVQGAGDMNNCTWRGSDKIVADVSKVQAAVGWTAVSRGGLNGLMFEKDGVHGVVEASEESTICFTLQAEMAGDYYTIIVSSAPHETDNNDLWIKSSKGFHLLRDGDVRREGAGIWLKGYQNEGGNALADYLLTVDHWGHAFIVQGVEKDVAFEICIAGRSSLYEVYRLVVVKCSSELCLDARPAPGSLIFNEPSVCS